MVLQLGAFSSPDIQLFSAAGAPMGRILWNSGHIVEAGWTSEEEFLVVNDRGMVHRYLATGAVSNRGQPFSLGAGCEEEGLADVVFFQDGIVARTLSGHLWCIEDVGEPRVTRFPSPSAAGGVVHCMAAVAPSLSLSGTLEVLVAIDSTVVVVDARGVTPTTVTEGPIAKLAVSPDGRCVAGFAADDVLHLWNASFEEHLASLYIADTADDMADALGIDTTSLPSGPPESLVWCGSDAILAAWPGTGALLLTQQGAYRWWDLGSGAVALVGEVDGGRAVTNSSHLFLRRVPPSLASVLEIGSTSPGALLHDARQLYESRDARAAAELLEVLRAGDLPEAVAACLGAAAAELDPAKQESLLQAGCYGRAFMALQGAGDQDEVHGGTSVLDVARKLRVANALRAPEVGLPITLPQLDALGLGGLAARLALRRQYLLALRVCEALGASTESVLFQWACDKIEASASSAPDEELLTALRAKLDGRPGVKWARIAAHARLQGRPRLAAALAGQEVCAGEQVPLLLELGEEGEALRRATRSGDPDLVFLVVHTMWRRAERSGGADSYKAVWEGVQGNDLATASMAQYLESINRTLPLSMWNSLGEYDKCAAAHICTGAAACAAGAEAGAAREWTKAKEAFAQAERAGAEMKFESAAAAAAIRLMDVQAELQRTTGREGFVGLSAVDTVRQCLRVGLRDQAQRVAREFKIPEKQQMLIAAGVTASSHDWPSLQQMASKIDRRAPISMEHFVRIARAHGAPLPVVKWFVDRISVGDNALVRRAQLYAELGLHQEAMLVAEQAEQQGAGAGVLGSLRGALGGTVGSLVGRS